MVDYISLLQRLVLVLDFNVEFRKLQADKDDIHVSARIASQDLATLGRGRTHMDAKQRAAKEMLIKIFELYQGELIASLQMDKLSILRLDVPDSIINHSNRS